MLALIDSFFEFVWIFVKEEKREASNKFFLSCGDYTDFILPFIVVIVKNFNGFPAIFITLIHWGESMSLTRSGLTVFNPLFNRSVFIPCIISGKDFNTWHIRLIEDLIFFLKQCNRILCGLVFVDARFNFLKECFLFVYFMMLLDHLNF